MSKEQTIPTEVVEKLEGASQDALNFMESCVCLLLPPPEQRHDYHWYVQGIKDRLGEALAKLSSCREEPTFFCCPPAITCKCNCGTIHKMVELFGLHGDSAVTDFTASIQALGIQVVAKACPPSTAEWVELPFLREKSGSSYYGPEAITGFITRIMQEPRICEHKWDGDEVITGGRGYGSSVTCSKCGMSAMSHDVRCC